MKKSVQKSAPVKEVTKKSVKQETKPAEAPKRKVTTADLVEVSDTTLLVSIDLRRQAQAQVEKSEITDDQKFFPYAILPRLIVGWQTVGFISSFELKLSTESAYPQMVVRFVEKMSKEDMEKLEPDVKEQILSQINVVRQYPFVQVESPLLG